MMDKYIQQRIDDLYANMKPLQDYYGIKSKTIDERYEDYLRKQKEKERLEKLINAVPKPRFKLPKL